MTEPSIEFFLALESQVWEALTGGDASADRELLGDDFVGIYPSGFADRSGHADQLNDGRTIATYLITEQRLIRLTETAVLLCYRAEYQRVGRGASGAEETMYVSSLWTERTGRWWNIFSQDTPALSPQDG